MECLKDMLVFAKVVELAGSFTSAARQLTMSVPASSQKVSRLAAELQVKRLNRSTHSTGMTEARRIYYPGCRRRLTEIHQVHEQIYAFNNSPVGMLRIGSSSTRPQNVLAAMSEELLKIYPGLTVNIG